MASCAALSSSAEYVLIVSCIFPSPMVQGFLLPYLLPQGSVVWLRLYFSGDNVCVELPQAGHCMITASRAAAAYPQLHRGGLGGPVACARRGILASRVLANALRLL